MFRSVLRHPTGSEREAAVSRYELLASVVEGEAIRSGDTVGYQWAIIDILRCLDEVERGRADARRCSDLIYEHIARAVSIDPFDRRSVSAEA